MRHFGIYANSGDVQTALNEETLVNPYVALVSGALDYDTLEQQSCEERGFCGDDPTDCHECSCQEQFSDPVDVCTCEGRYFWDGECHDEPEPADPCGGYETQEECECVQQGGSWEGSECVMPPQTCEEQGLCDDGEGNCVACEEDCGDASPEECECIQQGGTWDGSHGSSEGTCNLPSDDPCAEYGSQEECDCVSQGGTWDGSECHMPSDE